jgi:hypothetical protein
MFTKDHVLDLLVSMDVAINPQNYLNSKDLETGNFLDLAESKANELGLLKEFRRSKKQYAETGKMTYEAKPSAIYSLVEFPAVQEYMDEPWFEEEAILALGAEDQFGGSAYFIPIKRTIKPETSFNYDF